MLLQSLLPQLPSSLEETVIFVVGALGVVLLPYAVFIEKERRQDLLMAVGAACLLVYSIYRNDVIASLAFAALFLASLVEFGQIYLGLHRHSPEDLKRYKAMK